MRKNKDDMFKGTGKGNDLKDVLVRYRLFFIAALVLILGGLLFKIGVLYSCQDGYLQGNRCIKPKEVGTVKVCEAEPYTCIETCASFQIEDRHEFCSEYCEIIPAP